MKTLILRLHQDSDLTTISQRITWGNLPRVLLVWPRRGSVLTRRLDLVLLQRQAARMGARIALVTHDAEVINHAGELDIPVFQSIYQAHHHRWGRTPHKIEAADPSQRPDLWEDRPMRLGAANIWGERPLGQAIFSLAGLFAVLALVACLLPSAKVTLPVRGKVQQLLLTVRAVPGLESVQVSGEVPIRTNLITVEGDAQALTSGEMEVGSQAAAGNLTFTNLTSQAVIIPKGTVVFASSEGAIRFETTQEGQLPAEAGATVDLPIRAVDAGTRGNVAAEMIQGIEGPLGLQVSVNNGTATQGGQDIRLAAPSDQDLKKLREDLLARLERQSSSQAAADLPKSSLLVPGSVTLKQIVNEKSQPSSDQPGDEVRLHIEADYEVRYVSGDDLREMASRAMNALLPATYPGYQPLHDTVRWENANQPVAEADGSVHWQMQAYQAIEPADSARQITRLIAGLSPQEAARRVQVAYGSLGSPVIQITPGWWPWLPFLPFRISIEG